MVVDEMNLIDHIAGEICMCVFYPLQLHTMVFSEFV